MEYQVSIMTAESSTEGTKLCPCCGEPLKSAEPCVSCSAALVKDDKLDVVTAEIVIDKCQTKYQVSSRWVRIGRDSSNQIVLNDDKYSSRFHAWVTYEANKFWLEDLGSTNGTFLNSELVEKRELLSPGDKIRVGETDLTFVLLGST